MLVYIFMKASRSDWSDESTPQAGLLESSEEIHMYCV